MSENEAFTDVTSGAQLAADSHRLRTQSFHGYAYRIEDQPAGPWVSLDPGDLALRSVALAHYCVSCVGNPVSRLSTTH
jgi:hypothetical protein